MRLEELGLWAINMRRSVTLPSDGATMIWVTFPRYATQKACGGGKIGSIYLPEDAVPEAVKLYANIGTGHRTVFDNECFYKSVIDGVP